MIARLLRLAAAPLAFVLVAAAPADPAAADRIRGQVQFLASDQHERRDTASRG